MAFTLIRCKDAWSSNYRYIESDIAPLTGSATPYHLSSSYDIYSSGDYYQTAVFGAHDYIYIFALFDSEPIITQNTMGHNLDRGVFYDSNSGLWVLMAHAGFGLKEHWTDRSGGITCDCQFFDYINYDSLAQTRQAYLAYIQTVYVPPITYNWQSVPSISGKNGILSLVTLDSESINDGEPVSGAAVSVFDQNPVSGNNVKDIVDGNTPLIPSAVDVTAAFIISNPPVGELASRILAAKKDSIPESIEDADKTISIPANASNVTMPGLDENSQYYFAIFVADAVGDTAVSDPKDIYTSADEGWSFDYTGEIQTFVAPKTGIYQLETWGAQGGDATDGTNSARGGYGAYAVGEVLLQQGDTLYINVGGQNGYGGGGNYQSQNQYRYVKLVIKDNRGHTSVTQLSRIMLHDVSLQQTVDFSNATATSTPEGNTGEKANKLIDYDVNTKLCISNYTPSSNNPITIIIDIGADIDFDIYNTWEWWTANDHNERDPITFDLYLSKNGTDYVLVDSAENTNPTTERHALGYTKTLTL